jgi:DNA-binding GntR family transcriptional regulator
MATAQELAYNHIKTQILSCDLQPGQRLVALELAAKIGLSRTPVREALSRLEQEDIVARESGWGYVVKTMDFKDLMDLYRVREILEVEAAVEAVSFVDDVRIATLRDLLRRASEAMEARPYSEFISLIRSVTAFIAEMTGNKLLQDMISRITDRVQIVGAQMVRHNLSRAKEILDENTRIIEALAKRDAAAVEAAMRTHVRNGRDAAAKLIGARNRTAAAAQHS